MSLAPALTALLAASDHSHHVVLRQTAQGPQVVLQHDCLNSPTHRHGLIARALTVFAERAATPQSDHVINFAATDPAQQVITLSYDLAANSPGSDGNVAPCLVLCADGEKALKRADFPQPAPDVNNLLLAVHSIVLLI